MYDYMILDFKAPAEGFPAAALSRHIRERGGLELGELGGDILGVFRPQLGWKSTNAALLIGWRGPSAGRLPVLAALSEGPDVNLVFHQGVTATTRPLAGSVPEPGGIYVHRWFVIDAEATDEFIAISAEAWVDFEDKFSASIYGLFLADQKDEDRHDSVRRLLLITRYEDHGVWEQSRDPSTTAMKLFYRRAAITKNSWGASTVLVPRSVWLGSPSSAQ